ncbi:MAG: NAD+ synthase [Candidatus Helarchaeota archaeon]
MDYQAEIDRITHFIKDIIQNSKTKGAIVGLSGGIDSSLTATLCVRALGKEKTFALILPCHSTSEDVEDAMLVAKFLGIDYRIIDLSETYDVFVKALSQGQEISNLAKANLKPRLRMCALYFYANQMNYLVAGTGNKSEDEIGYFTKYGDGGVDFLPIQHLYKHEVREMAKFLNIPEKIVNRTPTAGLWEGQTDEDEITNQLGFPITYEILDEMLEKIITNRYDPQDKKYQKLIELREKNKHKLHVPPALNRI